MAPGSSRQRFTFRGNLASTRHGWLRLTPAYSVHLVRELLDGVDATRGPVLDPFCGTGTTLLACAERGIDCTTVDLNPFLVWLARAKTARYDAPSIDDARALVGRMAHAARARSAPMFLPSIHHVERWWTRGVLHALGRAAAEAEASDEGNRGRDLASLALCRALIETANVSFGHQSMSFREPDGKKTGRDVAAALERALDDLLEPASAHLPRSKRTVVLGDSRGVGDLVEGRFGAVVTSPPYSNRMSYIRELRPYMYWLRHLVERRDAGELDWRAIGGTWGAATSRLGTWRPDACANVNFPDLARIVAKISEREPLLGNYVHRYFEDMAAHAKSLFPVMAPGARLNYVVGNSKFYDVLLPAQEIFVALFEAAGFRDCRITELRKRTSKRELFEYLVEASAPAATTRDAQAASSMPKAATPRRRSSRRTSVAPP
jgi:SAM-dependent methyltransferase